MFLEIYLILMVRLMYGYIFDWMGEEDYWRFSNVYYWSSLWIFYGYNY